MIKTTTTTKPATKRTRRMAREPQTDAIASSSKAVASSGDESAVSVSVNQAQTPPSQQASQSKTALVLEMLRRPNGATLDHLVTATGWLPHTTRAALTGLRKKGHALTSEKVDGVRRYRIATAPNPAGATQ